MAQAPFLTTVDSNWFKTIPKRGSGISWEYEIVPLGQVGGLNIVRFRLEVVLKN